MRTPEHCLELVLFKERLSKTVCIKCLMEKRLLQLIQLKLCHTSAFEEALHFFFNGVLNEIIKNIVISVVYEVW